MFERDEAVSAIRGDHIPSVRSRDAMPDIDVAVSSGSPMDPAKSALLPFAKLLVRELRLRNDLHSQIDEPRWMILLDIYIAMSEGRDTPSMSAAHASSVPVSTAQRYIRDMIEAGLLDQQRSNQDQRITNVSLTPASIDLVNQALIDLQALRNRK